MGLPADTAYLSYTVHPDRQRLRTYWLGADEQPMRHFNALAGYAKKSQETLVFATNGGMFEADHSPVGLYVEHGRTLHPLDTTAAAPGNFYLQPNGVFWVDTSGRGHVTPTADFRLDAAVDFATQSGPMLLIDGATHDAFRQNSPNALVRSGVGVLPDGRVHLAMSRGPVSFYAFADYFRRLGCRDALYLDGVVSRVYDPAVGERGADGRFGVMIGVSEPW